MEGIGKDIYKAKKLLEKGEVVALPTETVYGLGASAIDDKAVQKIFDIKERPLNNPLIVHFSSIEKIIPYVSDPPELFFFLGKELWPGPMTFILNKNEKISNLVSGGLPTIGVRIPRNKLALEFLSILDFPVVAPSANPFKYISPTSPQHVEKTLGNKIEYILDGETSDCGIESTIVKYIKKTNTLYILRPGFITKEILEETLKNSDYKDTKVEYSEEISEENIESPGMFLKHYSPHKKLILFEDDSYDLNKFIKNKTSPKICAISYSQKIEHPTIVKNIILSKNKDIFEAARNLYSALIEADNSEVDFITISLFDEEDSLAKSLNDRIKRAAF